ncbi:hypothetical protein [Paracoccus everestensis]|nr:hypothetical protein [Paracoccus everestensis]
MSGYAPAWTAFPRLNTKAVHAVKAFRIGLVVLAFQAVQRSPAVW